jgi:hypothetical protein
MTTKARTPKAAALAVSLVEQWFQDLTSELHENSAGDIDALCMAVETELEKEYVKLTGEEVPDDAQPCAREAGYLIGLQIGMRLRSNEGGPR